MDTLPFTFIAPMGFAAVAGFAMMKAMKFAFKIMMIILGIILFGVFTLQYYGFIDGINWNAISVHGDSILGGIAGFFETIFGFAKAQLQNAAAFTGGMYLAWRYA